MENVKSEETSRSATVWDRVHALALCVLAVVGIVIFVGPYVERLFVQGGGQGAQQPVLVSPWGRTPLASQRDSRSFVRCRRLSRCFPRRSCAYVRMRALGRAGAGSKRVK